MEYGFAVAEMKDVKKILLHTGVTGAVEFGIKKNFFLSAGFGGCILQHSYTTPGEQVFNRKCFLTMPLSFKKYYSFSNRSSGFLDIGMCAAYYFLDKKEIRNSGTPRVEKRWDIGWNGAGLFGVGFKTMITPVVSFEIGLLGQKDIFRSYSMEQDRLKTEKTALFIGFYRKL